MQELIAFISYPEEIIGTSFLPVKVKRLNNLQKEES